jgi:CBS domain-containing protein
MITANQDDAIKNVVAKMDQNNIKEIPIVENKILKGMITYYDILDFVKADPNEKTSSLMIKPPTVNADTHIDEIITLMLQSGMEAIPVIEKGELIGLISDYDIVINMLNEPKIKKLKVRDVMDETTKLLKADDSMSEARRLMRYHKWPKLPIVDLNGKLLGMISSTEILKTFYKMPRERVGSMAKVGGSVNPLMMPVSEFMITDIPRVSLNESVPDVIKKLIEKKLKGAPVVDDEGKVIGMFERWNILDKLIERRFNEGVWLNFSGFPLSIDTIEILKNYLSADIKKMKTICPEMLSIDVHIKKLHGATPEKWNYEVNVHLVKKSGKGEIVTNKEPWYGYNLMFTLQDAFNKLINQLEHKYVERDGKHYYTSKNNRKTTSKRKK